MALVFYCLKIMHSLLKVSFGLKSQRNTTVMIPPRSNFNSQPKPVRQQTPTL